MSRGQFVAREIPLESLAEASLSRVEQGDVESVESFRDSDPVFHEALTNLSSPEICVDAHIQRLRRLFPGYDERQVESARLTLLGSRKN